MAGGVARALPRDIPPKNAVQRGASLELPGLPFLDGRALGKALCFLQHCHRHREEVEIAWKRSAIYGKDRLTRKPWLVAGAADDWLSALFWITMITPWVTVFCFARARRPYPLRSPRLLQYNRFLFSHAASRLAHSHLRLTFPHARRPPHINEAVAELRALLSKRACL